MPSNHYVTVHTGHIDSGANDYFRYYGDGDSRNGAGVAILQSMPWWGDADLAEQWALNSHYASPNLNIDGGTGGDEEQVAFAYDFYLWGEARNTRYLTKRKPDDWHNYAPDPAGDENGQNWSGGYAVDYSTFSGITLERTGTRNGTDLLTTEAGGSSTFTIVLDTAPTANVTVSITGLKTQEGLLDTDTLVFTTTNWDTPQTVTVTGVDDAYANGDYTYSLVATASNTGGYAGTERAATNVTNIDDDVNGVTIAQTGTTSGADLLTTEAGSTSTFTVVLNAAPIDDVTVSITGLDTTENSLSTDSLTFTTANWNTPQTVTVTGVDDPIADGDITTTLTATASNTGGYAGTETATTTVKNTDDDTNGITIAQTGTTSGADLLTTEAGSTSTFTVMLDAEPTANVTVSITGLDTTENSLSSDTLTFTTGNWFKTQTVTVTGVDDTLVDSDITTTLTATASNTGGYAGTETATTTVKNTDDDTGGITIAQTGTTDGSDLLTTEAGSSSTFTVVLDAQPADTVTVSISGLDATENSLSTDTLTFTTGNWNTPQTVTVTGVDDTPVDGDITTTLTAIASNTGGYAGNESTTTTVKNEDDDTTSPPPPLGINIIPTGTTDNNGNLITSESGSSTTFTVALDAQPSAEVDVFITGNDPTEGSLSSDSLAFNPNNWNSPQTVTVTGVIDDLVDGDILTTITARTSNTGGYTGNETATINVINQDVAPPLLQYNKANNQFTVEGSDGTGLWLQFKTTGSAANWQTSLCLHSSAHDAIKTIGATSRSENLGFLEIFVAAGETISFSQHSRESDISKSPSLLITATEFGHSLAFNDNNSDNDFNDLMVDVTSSLKPQQPENILLASQQISSASAIYDFTSIPYSGLTVELSINSDCSFKNQLAFVALAVDPLSGLPYSDYRIGTITPDDHSAYKAAILNNLVHPSGETITATGQKNQIINWSLTPEEAGFYAPVLISPTQEVFTAGLLSCCDGKQHTKLLGQNFIGFEDTVASQQPDWDFNDVTVLATVVT